MSAMFEEIIYPFSHITQKFPEISLRMSVKSQDSESEAFCIEMAKNTVDVQAESTKALEFALYHLLVRLKSRRVRDIVGRQQPLFSIRPLIVSADQWYRLPSGLFVALPASIVEDPEHLDKLEGFVHRVLEIGWNTVVFDPVGEIPETCPELTWEALRHMKALTRGKGLFTALSFAEKEEERQVDTFFSHLQAIKGCCTYLLWKSGTLWEYRKRKQGQFFTEYEEVQQEVYFVQKEAPLPLFYFLGAKNYMHAAEQSHWLSSLSHAASKKSMIAFEAFLPTSRSERYAKHPFFSKAQRFSVPQRSSLVPMLSVDSADLANNGQVIDFALDRWEHIVGSAHPEDFCGLGCRISCLPERGTLAHAPLWVLGQRLWEKREVYALLDSWLFCFHSSWLVYFEKGLAEHIHRLFWKKQVIEAVLCEPDSFSKEAVDSARLLSLVEEATDALELFARFLTQCTQAKELIYETASISLLSSLLYMLQVWYKEQLVHYCRKAGCAFASKLQGFFPVELLPGTKDSE